MSPKHTNKNLLKSLLQPLYDALMSTYHVHLKTYRTMACLTDNIDNVDDGLALLNHELAEKGGANISDVHSDQFRWRQSPKQRQRAVFLGLSCSVATALIMFTGFLTYMRHTYSRPLQWEASISSSRPGTISCGISIEQAISRGCAFDELSMSWLPPKCTKSYADEYLAANNGTSFDYWFDRYGTMALHDPSQHVGSDDSFWTSRRNHLVHCQYNLYRLADALNTGDYIGHDKGQSLSAHMHHCVMTMAEFALKAPAHELDVIDVITEASFGYC